tara:strand:+ start:152 stop:400 length:249 start_codon:yes stop_codon:yes gene_type:complete
MFKLLRVLLVLIGVVGLSACQERDQAVFTSPNQMMALVQEYNQNQQAFGLKILRAQTEFAKTGNNGNEVKMLLAVVGMYSPE